MINAFHLGNIDFDFILGTVLVVLILITQVRMTIHAHLLKDDMGTDLAAGKIRKRTIHRVYFIKNTIIYNYTFEVEGIAYKGKYVESYRKMKKRGELPDEQRIKYYTANPKINCLADMKSPSVWLNLLVTVMALAFIVWYFWI